MFSLSGMNRLIGLKSSREKWYTTPSPHRPTQVYLYTPNPIPIPIFHPSLTDMHSPAHPQPLFPSALMPQRQNTLARFPSPFPPPSKHPIPSPPIGGGHRRWFGNTHAKDEADWLLTLGASPPSLAPRRQGCGCGRNVAQRLLELGREGAELRMSCGGLCVRRWVVLGS